MTNYNKHKCEVCEKEFMGDDAAILAERCAKNHAPIVISFLDYELVGFLNWINSRGRTGKLPKNFTKKIRFLQSRALRGK